MKRSYKNGPQPMYLPLLSRPRFSPAQVEALDAIGSALAASALSWDEAVELRDVVKLGGPRTALRKLKKLRRQA
jgi:hypothetical protein